MSGIEERGEGGSVDDRSGEGGGAGRSPYPGLDRVGSVEQVRALDRRAVADFGVPSEVLMESAGRACADAAERLIAGSSGPVVVVCGPGNNGGDGLVIARTLHNRGHDVRTVLVGRFDPADGLSADTRGNLERLTLLGLPATRIAPSAVDPGAILDGVLDGAALIVDALFGTGLARRLEPPFSTAVDRIGAARAPVLAVDLPSGLEADLGEKLGPVAEAAVTVTFAVWKRGLLEGAGPSCCGAVEVAEIGIPRPLLEALPRLPPGSGPGDPCRD